ncbi:hypothetical protein [Pseudomonas sp.]|uniref:hypothetical protein n=1 Tax=Pseudomonas sp. TaxID=306 RepID=UPI0005EB6BA6
MRRFTVRLLQSLGLAPVAYLFVCLINASIGQTPFGLALPSMVDPDSNSMVELLLFTAPGQLLFLLASCFIHSRRLLCGAFVLSATLTMLLQCLLFAQTFGATWSSAEILGLWVINLPWLLLALIPGLGLLIALDPLKGPFPTGPTMTANQPSSTIS